VGSAAVHPGFVDGAGEAAAAAAAGDAVAAAARREFTVVDQHSQKRGADGELEGPTPPKIARRPSRCVYTTSNTTNIGGTSLRE
jgi:hypothetical protein